MVEADIMVTSNTGYQSLWGNEEYKTDSTSARYFTGIPHGKNYSFALYIGGTTSTAGTFNLGQNVETVLQVITHSNKKVTMIKDGTVVSNGSYSETI